MATPPRGQFFDVALDLTTSSATFGKPVSTTRVTVYLAVPLAAASLTTLASIFTAETGAGTPGNPFNATTGEINFWMGPGSYDVVIQDTGSPKKFADKIVRIDNMPYDKGIQTAMLADNLVTSGKVAADQLASSHLTPATRQLLVQTGLMFPWPAVITGSGASATGLPAGFLPCDGSNVQISQFGALDALFGAGASTPHIFNGGNSPGSGLFKLPDLQGRVPVGKGTLSEVATLGNSDGLAVGSRKVRHQHGRGTLGVVSGATGLQVNGNVNGGQTGGQQGSNPHAHGFSAGVNSVLGPSGNPGGFNEPGLQPYSGGPAWNVAQITSTDTAHTHSVSVSDPGHGHTLSGSIGDTAGPTDGPAFQIFNWIIKT